MKDGDSADRALLDLKRLPRVDASEGFTEGVLRRARTDQAVDASRGRPGRSGGRVLLRRARTDQARQPAPRLRLALAATAVVVVSAAAGAWWARQSAFAPAPTPITAETIERLRSEYEELDRELESLRRLAEDTQPFVPVSIDPRTEVLFDLRDIEPLPVSLASTGSRRIQ